MSRKPTELLELNGAFRHNAQRRRPVGPKSSQPIGKAPAYMTAAEVSVWNELVANSPAGILTITDRPLLEIVTRLLSKFRASQEILMPALLTQLNSGLSRLGWTPADRSRVAPVKTEDKGEFDFLQ
jgi:hypothetical protein